MNKIEVISGWESPVAMLKVEARQKRDEGYMFTSHLMEAIDSLSDENGLEPERICSLYKLMEQSERDEAIAHSEPNDLLEIRRLRPQGPRQLNMDKTREELFHHFHGAWTGRAVGCALGKPVELIGFGHNSRANIKNILQRSGDWPLSNYFSASTDQSHVSVDIKNCLMSCREHISYMEPDDDIHYTLIALKILEEHGSNFKWHHIADAWNDSLPYNAICTAETQAILNYNMVRPRLMNENQLDRHLPSPWFTSRHNNPYREWIGAQIRADGWAYACAGHPELAAEFAWRDAHWTHTGNGIYGEMFMAAMISAAFVENDPRRLVEIGLSEIPENCRLAQAIRQALLWIEIYPEFEAFMDKADEVYADMSPVHTINNAVICVMSIFYGKMDPDRSIAISVMAGLDTDCNGATVGSIVGAAGGRLAFGQTLSSALNDTIQPKVFGFEKTTMTELATRSLKVYENISKAEG